MKKQITIELKDGGIITKENPQGLPMLNINIEGIDTLNAVQMLIHALYQLSAQIPQQLANPPLIAKETPNNGLKIV